MLHKTKPFARSQRRHTNEITLRVQSGMYDHVTLFVSYATGMLYIKRWCSDNSLTPMFEMLKFSAHPELRELYDAQHKAWNLAAVNCLFVGFEFPDMQL